MYDDKTPHLALPLPHPGNPLEVDVLRLRAALDLLDTRLFALDELLAVEDDSLDTVREIVEAVKLAHADIAALNALIDTEIADALTGVRADIAHLQSLVPLIYAGL
jgi:hypothetical protein